MIENIFDAPVPGQSLTDTPKNAPWENPPQFVDLQEASEYVWQRLHDESILEQVIMFLKNDIPVEAVARMVLFGGFMEGKWTPDLAILLSEIVFKQVMAIGMKAEVPKMKMFLKDQGTNKFYKNFAKFKLQNESSKKMSKQEDSRAKKFAEEVKKELEEKETGGLMTKENN